MNNNLTKQQKIQNNFDRGALNYDTDALLQKSVASQLVEYLRTTANNDLLAQENLNVLDIGAGTGFATEALLTHFPHASYTLNDLSSKMLQIAAQKFAKHHKVQFLLGDAEKQNFAEAELIISNLALQWFADIERAVTAFWNKTKIIAFTTLSNGSLMSWKKLYQTLGLIPMTHNYPTAYALQQYCLDLNPKKYFFTTKNYNLNFTNSLAFARHLKKIGANTPNDKIHINKNIQRNACNLHKLLIQTTGVNFVTNYEIFFAVLVK